MRTILKLIPITLLAVALVWIVALRAQIAQSEPWAMAPPEVDMGGIVTVEKHVDLAAEAAPIENEEAAETHAMDIPLDDACKAALFESCEAYGVDTALALGLIWTESRFDPTVVSCAGCYGLCQLSPVYFPAGLTPAENIRYGIRYLAECIMRYGSVEGGLTAYNVGHDNGTRGYANAVLTAAENWTWVYVD